MMDTKPSQFALKYRSRVSRSLLLLSSAAALSACVSQSEVLTIDTSLQQPSPQLGLASNGDLSSNTAPNIPIRAPRPTLETANLTAGGSETSTASATQQSSSSVLAAVDPAQPTVPAQTVIENAAASPTSAEVATAAPTTEVASVSTSAAPTTPEAAAVQATSGGTTEVTKPDLNTSDIPSTTAEAPKAETQQLASLSAPAVPEPVAAEKPKATGLFARLFQGNGTKKLERPQTKRTNGGSAGRGDDDGGVRIASAHATAKKSKSPSRPKTVRIKQRDTSTNSALPGVKSTAQIFGVKEDDTAASSTPSVTQVAAVGSLGRLSPNGIRVQHSKVQVACLKPGILRMLKQVERKYGRKPIVTSGYRSPKRNRRAGGAKNSMHIYCKAADIQVEGVSKWQLAKYLRTLPGRGGVGTYCRTKSVHIDTGSVRDWHHPCRRSSKRKKRKT